MKILLILLLLQTNSIRNIGNDEFNKEFQDKVINCFEKKFSNVDSTIWNNYSKLELLMESEWGDYRENINDPIRGLKFELKNYSIEFIFKSSIITNVPLELDTYKEKIVFRIMIFPKNDFIKGKEVEFRLFINQLMDLSKLNNTSKK